MKNVGRKAAGDVGDVSNPVDLTSEVTGVLPVGNGGSGGTNFDTQVAATAAVAANSGKVTNATHTGDVTGSGALTIAAAAVTNAKLADVATATMKGRSAGGTGPPSDLPITTIRTMVELSRFTSAAGTPSSTPTAKGNRYFDSTNNEDWVAIGTSSSADWRLVPRLKNPTSQSGATYTFVRADGDSMVEFTGANPTATIPTNASVPFPLGTTIMAYCSGTTLTVANLRLQGSPLRTVPTDRMLMFVKKATDTWMVIGGMS